MMKPCANVPAAVVVVVVVHDTWNTVHGAQSTVHGARYAIHERGCGGKSALRREMGSKKGRKEKEAREGNGKGGEGRGCKWVDDSEGNANEWVANGLTTVKGMHDTTRLDANARLDSTRMRMGTRRRWRTQWDTNERMNERMKEGETK